MTEGWTTFDYALAVWAVGGFLVFTIAGLFQLPRWDKDIQEGMKDVGSGKQTAWDVFGQRRGLEIDASTSGLVGGMAFVIVTSGMAGLMIRYFARSGDEGLLFVGGMLSIFCAYALFHLLRGFRERMNRNHDETR